MCNNPDGYECQSDGSSSSIPPISETSDDELSTGTANASDCQKHVRYARNNTIYEKRRMCREAKQGKKLCLAAEKLQEHQRGEKQKTSTPLYKSMARTYWDRWQWELQKRKEAMQELRTGGQRRQPESHGSLLPVVHEIDPSSH